MTTRTKKQNIAIIAERVRIINEKLGTRFIAHYDDVWKVWSMYEVGKNGELCSNTLGFDGKTMEEMYGFTDGIFRMFDYLHHNDTSAVKW